MITTTPAMEAVSAACGHATAGATNEGQDDETREGLRRHCGDPPSASIRAASAGYDDLALLLLVRAPVPEDREEHFRPSGSVNVPPFARFDRLRLVPSITTSMPGFTDSLLTPR